MPTNPDRALERLLKAELRGATGTPATPECVDAETFAAWAEGTLPAAQTALVETHLADCARCQALVAAFAKIDATPAAASVVPFRARFSARWLIPIAAGTLAATLLLWTMWPSNPVVPPVSQTMAEVQPAAPPVAPPIALSDRTRSQNEPKNAAKDDSKRQEAGRLADAKLKSELARQQPAPGGVADTKRATAAPVAALPPPPPPPPAQVVAPQPVARPTPPPPARADASAAGVAGGVIQNETAITTTIVAEFSSSDMQFAQSETVTTTAAAGAAGAGGGGGRGGGGGGRGGARGGGGAAATAPVLREAVSVAPVRWRVMSTGSVQRSADSGTTWEPVAIDPPAPITGGIAPSPLVCWLIARNGVVLLSIDGVHFNRVTSPAAVDLRSITSTGPRDATVTTVDGRTFTTADGGQTWTLRTS